MSVSLAKTPAKPADKKPFIAVNLTPAMSGYFATLYDWSWMEGGINIHGEAYEGQWFAEPYDTGCGRYDNWQQANAEAKAWAEDIGCEVQIATAERVAEAEASAAASRKRIARIVELRKGGMSLTEARAAAIAELGEEGQ